MSQYLRPLLTAGVIDRDAATRTSDELLEAAWSEPATRLLCVHEGKIPLLEASDEHAKLDLIAVTGRRTDTHHYLGRCDGDAVFAVELDAVHDDIPQPAAGWRHPFSIGDLLSEPQQELMTIAMALTHWHRTMPFSPRDGEATTVAQGGWARIDAHGGEHFPRMDPAVIVLVEHDDRLLLGSNVLWQSGRFSLLAGFVEAGESAEQAVKREIFEECDLAIGDVQYVASQPWPFPRSLMLGFRASIADGVDPDALVADASEISELRWFTRNELRDPAPGLMLPGKLSIARWLLDLWINEGDRGR